MPPTPETPKTPESLAQPTVEVANETVIAARIDTSTVMTDQPEALPADFPSPADHYRLVIEDARSLGNRRDAINSMFVNIVSLIAGGAGYVLITYPGNTAGLAVVLAASIFGWRLCHVWDDAIGYYKSLLNFRYTTLKVWEEDYRFPPLQRYYITEDLLYEHLKTKTDLSVEVLKKDAKLEKQGGNFVDLYKALPHAARIVFLVLALLQTIAFTWRISSPYLLQMPEPWRLLPVIKL